MCRYHAGGDEIETKQRCLEYVLDVLVKVSRQTMNMHSIQSVLCFGSCDNLFLVK